ncbi:MAG: TonB family protein [Candidatus Accumulibacter sp.]|jgi:protein TonB|nr:TonB family protein [Accumulibacter sp.]
MTAYRREEPGGGTRRDGLQQGRPPRRDAATRSPLGRWLLLSLSLHAAALGGPTLAWHWSPSPKPPEKLVVELFGMVANRQTEEAQLGEKALETPPEPLPPEPLPPEPPPSAPPPETPPPPKAPPRPKTPKVTPQRQTSVSPVQVAEQPAEEPPPPPPDASQASSGAAEASIRRTIQHDEQDPNVLRRYLTTLKQAVKARLFYPPHAGGVTGTAVVAFRIGEDGGIEAGSLTIRNSSGHAVLDEAALHAVRSAAPFGIPPKAMNISLDMPFFEERP